MNTTVLPFGQDHRTIQIPDQWFGEVIHPQPVAPAVDINRLIQEALDHSIGRQRLQDSIKPGQRAAILVDDYTRKTPIHLLLPPILDRLRSAGVRYQDICIVIALGSHRAMTSAELSAKLGDGLIGVYPVVNSPGSAAGETIFRGTSRNGIPAWVNRAVAEADVRIGLGMITPHMDAGFSGGAKIVLPGVCSGPTVDAFHVRSADYPENPLGNPDAPLRNDLEAFVGERVPLDFILNVITTLDGDVYQCAAGDPIAAQRAGAAHARQVFGAPARQRYPIILANCSPYDHDLWQSMKGLWCGELLTAPGGTLILHTDAREGSRGYPRLPGYIGADPAQVKMALNAGSADDPKSASTGYLVGQMKKRFHISLVSPGLGLADAEMMGMSYYQTAEAAVEAAVGHLPAPMRLKSVGVLPQAGLVLPRLRH